jgi:hypothetical protein
MTEAVTDRADAMAQVIVNDHESLALSDRVYRPIVRLRRKRQHRRYSLRVRLENQG